MPTRTPAEKRTFYQSKRQTKRTAGTKKFYVDQNACWKRVTCIFAITFAKKRQPDFGNLAKPTGTKPKPRNKANQNHRRPKHERKTLKPILATRQNRPETTPTQKPPPTKTQRTWKPACWKNTDPKTLFEKSRRKKTNRRTKPDFAKTKTQESKTYLVFVTCNPTVCVTRAGAGGGTPSDWKNAEA